MQLSRSTVHLVALLAITGLLTECVVAASVPLNGNPVRMPPVETKEDRGYFEFAIEYDDISTQVKQAKLVWVSSAAAKASLRVGDQVVSIDGKPIRGFLHEAAFRALKGQVAPGEVRTIVFKRSGLFRAPVITYTIKGPNKAPDPTL